MQPKRNDIAQLIIKMIHRYSVIYKDDISNDSFSALTIDELISDMVEYDYITLDIEEDGRLLIKQLDSKDRANNKISEKSNAIFQSSTNEYMKEQYSGMNGTIKFKHKLLWFFGRYNEVIFRTSLLTEYEIKDNIAIFKTLNSTYEFELLSGIDEPTVASKEEIDKILSLDPRDFMI